MTLTDRLLRLARHQWRQALRKLHDLATQPSPRPDAIPPRHPYETEYRLLGAPIGADAETLRRCWRERVREWHPDRFAPDPVAMQAAAERLRRINEAYALLSSRRRI